jgi:hypothetical protein
LDEDSQGFDKLPEAVQTVDVKERARSARFKGIGWAIVIIAVLLSLLDVAEYRYQVSHRSPEISAREWERMTVQRRHHAALDFVVWEVLVIGAGLGAWLVFMRP